MHQHTQISPLSLLHGLMLLTTLLLVGLAILLAVADSEVALHWAGPGIAIAALCILAGLVSLYVILKRTLSDRQNRLAACDVMLNTIPNQIWVLQDPNHYRMANKAHLDFLGVTADELNGAPMADFITDESGKDCLAGNQRVFATGQEEAC